MSIFIEAHWIKTLCNGLSKTLVPVCTSVFERISKNDVRKALECLSLGKRASFEHRHPIYTTPFSWQGHWSLCGQLLACLHAIESSVTFYYLNRAQVTDNWIKCKQINRLNTSRRKYSERSATIRSTATAIFFRESDENIFEIMRDNNFQATFVVHYSVIFQSSQVTPN